MKWVLIFWIYSNQGVTTNHVEFSKVEQCTVARDWLVKNSPNKWVVTVTAECFPNG